MLVFAERGKPEYPEKNLSEQTEKRTNNKLNRNMTSSPGIEPGPHWWKASALTTAPSLLPAKWWELVVACVGSGVQTDATTPNNVGTCSALWEGYNP